MKKYPAFLLCCILFKTGIAQTSAAMKKITDSICDCISHQDMANIKNKEDANTVFIGCFSKSGNALLELAQERNVDMSDEDAMNKLGVEIGKELLRQNCPAFIQLSMKMASNGDAEVKSVVTGTTSGKLKRIDNKDFRYFIVVDENSREHSFIWMHYFPESEKFMENNAVLIGKKLKVHWQETEVFIPMQPKGISR